MDSPIFLIVVAIILVAGLIFIKRFDKKKNGDDSQQKK